MRGSYAFGPGLTFNPHGNGSSYQGFGWNGFSSRKGLAMAAWMEVLFNVIAYGGFIAVATYHRAPGNNSPE